MRRKTSLACRSSIFVHEEKYKYKDTQVTPPLVLFGLIWPGLSDELWAEQSEFDSRKRQGMFPYSSAFNPTLVPNQPLTRRVPGALFPKLKQPEFETDH
jgi:hypothetical protein